MSDELWSWAACRLVAAIRAGAVSAEEATASCLQRVQEVNPVLNAIVDLLTDEAMAEARAADEARRHGEALGPLHGVPVTVKVNVVCKQAWRWLSRSHIGPCPTCAGSAWGLANIRFGWRHFELVASNACRSVHTGSNGCCRR